MPFAPMQLFWRMEEEEEEEDEEEETEAEAEEITLLRARLGDIALHQEQKNIVL